MDVLQAMRVYRRVVELRGFSAAARDLRLSNAGVSKLVAQLEERLGVALLHRTTRRMAVTDEGAIYYERSVRILDDLDELERALPGNDAPARGRLRVNVPVSFGLLHIAPLVPEVLARWPELELELSFNDRFVDVIEEGADVVVRVAAELPDSATLVVQRLARARQVICATPAYLRRHGVPKTPEDLAGHECIVYGASRTPGVWELDSGEGPLRVAVSGRLVVDNSIVIRDALLAGVGLSLVPEFYVGPELERGRLRTVLDAFPARPLYVSALYPRARQLSARVRLFVELLKERLAQSSWAERS